MRIDLGCGTGRYFQCADHAESLVGVDPSEDMLSQAKQPVPGGKQNVALVRRTLHEVTFLPQSFDLALCVRALGECCFEHVSVSKWQSATRRVDLYGTMAAPKATSRVVV